MAFFRKEYAMFKKLMIQLALVIGLSLTIPTILKINPLYYIVQGYRESYLGGAWFWEHWQYSLYFWGVTIVLLLIGSTVFRRLKPHFSDVL